MTYPSAKAPDHCSKNPRMADAKITKVLLKFQSNESTPGGSKQGNIAARKIKVIGVVFHISLLINPHITDKEKKYSDANQQQESEIEISVLKCKYIKLLTTKPSNSLAAVV